MAKKPQPLTAVEQGIYLGEDTGATTTRRLSQIPTASLVPPPKPPRSDPKVIEELQKSAQSSPQPPMKIEKDPVSTESKESKASKGSIPPSCSIVRSISDYKTSDLGASAAEKVKTFNINQKNVFSRWKLNWKCVFQARIASKVFFSGRNWFENIIFWSELI